MRCEYSDGIKVDYSGSLRIQKGNEISGFLVKEDAMPDSFKYELDKAVRNNSCGELRNLALAVATDCGRVCVIK